MAAPEEIYQCQTVNCGYIYDPDRGDRKALLTTVLSHQCYDNNAQKHEDCSQHSAFNIGFLE